MNILYLIPFIILVILHIIFLFGAIKLINYANKTNSKIIKRNEEVSVKDIIFFLIQLNLIYIVYILLLFRFNVECIFFYYFLFIVVIDTFNRNIIVISNEKIYTLLYSFKKENIDTLQIKDNTNWFNKFLEITTNDKKIKKLSLPITSSILLKNILKQFDYNLKEEVY